MSNITIIGIGKLGLCNALCMEKAGYHVLGLDVSQDYVNLLNNKTYHSYEPKVNDFLKTCQNFQATTDFDKAINFADIIFIVVNTPNSGGEKFYDHAILSNVLSKINERQVENKHIVICCTVMPEYIQTIGKYLVKDCPRTTVNYNPEFIAQGNIIKGLEYPDMILIGQENDESGKFIEEINLKIANNQPKVCRLLPTEAEIVKISINGYITSKISYANMISDICDICDCDKNQVLKAIGSDSRIGQKYFGSGYSYGGPCFPRDTRALSLFLQQKGIPNEITKATQYYNDFHVEFQTKQYMKKAQNNPKESVTFTSICYKENSLVPIIEESAKLKIAYRLAQSGIHVIIEDVEHLIKLVQMEFGNIFEYKILD